MHYLQKKIKNITLPKEEEIFNIRAHFAQKHMDLAQAFYTMEEWHIQQVTEYCNTMQQILEEIMTYKAADVEIDELNEMELAIYIVLAVVVIGLMVWIVRYKAFGALGAIGYIGFVSLYLIKMVL